MQGRTDKSPERTGARGQEQVPAGVPVPPTRSALRRAARPRCRDQASPRGPAPAAAAARRAGWPAGVRPSFRPAGQERQALGSRGRGAAGRGARLPPRGSQLLPPPSFGPQPGLPGAEGAALRHGRPLAAGVWRRDRRTDGWTERGHPAGRAPRPGPKCRVTPGAARPVRRGAGARPAPPACAPPLAASTATPWETDLLCRPRGSGNRVSKVARPRRHCKFARDFLRNSRGPNLFQNKVRRKKQPHVLPVYHQPGRLTTRAQSRTRLYSSLYPTLYSSTYQVRRGGGYMHPVEGGPSWVPFRKMEKGTVRGRCLRSRLKNKPGPQGGRSVVQKASPAPLQ